ncbi:hypothetical protein GF362_06385 [Candidatus Dojkabacteria bacterium]|nr:hypothetical protein [Candidatus Dojkabacteria bacterium]
MEKEPIKEKLKYGFPNKTLIIDSQTAPPLRGVDVEQVYKRMYLMGQPEDICFYEEHLPIDVDYLKYLQKTLNVDIPEFISVPDGGTGTLPGDMLVDPRSIDFLQSKILEGYNIQFFNISEDLEVPLVNLVGNSTYCQDFEKVMNLGTKTGFRQFCEKYQVPVPYGKVCENIDDIVDIIMNLDMKSIMLKSRSGTAGGELGSNIVVEEQEIGQYSSNGTLDELIQLKIQGLCPSEFPLVAEQKLNLPSEGSIHIFIDQNGDVIYKPTIFGQIAEAGSYKGGFYPNNIDRAFEYIILEFADQTLVPALQSEGLTGFHCFDFLYDECTQDFALIEDNTRPGALDFINHFVQKVIESNGFGDEFTWYTKNISLEKLGMETTNFAHIREVLGDYIDPHSELTKKIGAFGLVSNPDVLRYGGDLNLTVVVLEDSEDSISKARDLYNQLVEKINYL